MCGDTSCGSCGPAQGHDPSFELVVDYLFEHVLAEFDGDFDVEEVANVVATKLGQHKEIADALYLVAKDWERKKRTEAAFDLRNEP